MPVITTVKRGSKLARRRHVRIAIQRMPELVGILLMHAGQRQLRKPLCRFHVERSGLRRLPIGTALGQSRASTGSQHNDDNEQTLLPHRLTNLPRRSAQHLHYNVQSANSDGNHDRIALMPATLPLPAFLYGTAWKEDRTPALTELALRMGFRAIDTANQRRHYFEAGVGQGLAAAYRAGLVTRADVFLQTKFTYQPGQDHRLPYDPAAGVATQVAQSLASSLEHLGTDHVDSFVLHGPASGSRWTDADAEVWAAMVNERDAGRTRLLGVSNVGLWHLEQMVG